MPRTAYGTARQGTTSVTVEYQVPDIVTNESVWDVIDVAREALIRLVGEDSIEGADLSAEIV